MPGLADTMRPHSAGSVRSPSDPSGLLQKASSGSDIKDLSSIGDEAKKVTITNELDFSRWYHDIEDGLLEASYEEYQYAQPSN